MDERLVSLLTNEEKRVKLQYNGVFLLLGGVSAFMTVLNIITGKGMLTVATAVFALLCLANFLLVIKGGRKGIRIASGLFMAEIISLFVFFLVSGNPDGFSAIWIIMLPACGMLLFGRKRAAWLCAVMFVIMVFFFWLPAGRSLLQYEYNPTFMMRFPLLYIAFFLLSALLETIRAVTQAELDRMREKYRHRAAHDFLTDLLNRQGLMELRESYGPLGEQAAMMIDIDLFKQVNDSYGHDVGDLVLGSVAQKITEHADTRVCRWGGEEFVVWFDDSRKMADPEEIRKAVEATAIPVPGCEKTVSVTVSIGVATGNLPLKELVSHADEAMYRAKKNGRNRVERYQG